MPFKFSLTFWADRPLIITITDGQRSVRVDYFPEPEYEYYEDYTYFPETTRPLTSLRKNPDSCRRNATGEEIHEKGGEKKCPVSI